jgi:hypothetical protein
MIKLEIVYNTTWIYYQHESEYLEARISTYHQKAWGQETWMEMQRPSMSMTGYK